MNDLPDHRLNEKQQRTGPLWILAIADRGIVVHASVHLRRDEAENALLRHLREHHRYDGPERVQAAWEWLEAHNETLSVEIVRQDTLEGAG